MGERVAQVNVNDTCFKQIRIDTVDVDTVDYDIILS